MVDRNKRESLQLSIVAIRDKENLSVGKTDMEQLASCITFELELVTNDRQFSKLATHFNISTHTAESILIEALREEIISVAEAKEILKKWKLNGERPSRPEEEDTLRGLGIACKNGFICDEQE